MIQRTPIETPRVLFVLLGAEAAMRALELLWIEVMKLHLLLENYGTVWKLVIITLFNFFADSSLGICQLNNDIISCYRFAVAEEDGVVIDALGPPAFACARGAPRQSSLNAMDAKNKLGKKKPGLLKGIGSMFR